MEYLFRKIKQASDQSTAVKSFFSYSDIPFSENLLNDIPDRKILLKGLDFLKSCKAKGDDTKRFLSILGENDIFLNAELLRVQIPNLDIIKGIGHAPDNLLKHLANRLNCDYKKLS